MYDRERGREREGGETEGGRERHRTQREIQAHRMVNRQAGKQQGTLKI